MNYKDALKIVKKYDKKLLATDPRFKYSIKLTHLDGSVFFVNHAFIQILKDLKNKSEKWILWYSEHNGYGAYHIDDLHEYQQFYPNSIENVNEIH